jgi:hypothetical protein
MILVDLSIVISDGIAKLKGATPKGFYYQDEDFLKIIEDEINKHAVNGERFCGLIHTHCSEKGAFMAFEPLQGKHKCRIVQFKDFDKLTTLEETLKEIEQYGQLVCSFVLQNFYPIYVFLI